MATAFDGLLLTKVRERLGKELQRLSEIILEGKTSTWEDYKRLVGERRGVKFALEAIDKSEQEALSPDDRARRDVPVRQPVM